MHQEVRYTPSNLRNLLRKWGGANSEVLPDKNIQEIIEAFKMGAITQTAEQLAKEFNTQKRIWILERLSIEDQTSFERILELIGKTTERPIKILNTLADRYFQNPYSELIRKELCLRLDSYEGSNSRLKACKKWKDVLESEDPPKVFALALKERRTSLKGIHEDFGWNLTSPCKMYREFFRHAIDYIDTKKLMSRYEQELYEILTSSREDKTFVKPIYDLILSEFSPDVPAFEAYYEKYYQMALEVLGDARVGHTWHGDSKRSQRAKENFVYWMNKKSLEIFWDIILNKSDPERRDFWLKLLPVTKNIRFDQDIKISDIKDKDHINARIVMQFKSVSAVIMHIGRYYFVEFVERASGPVQMIPEEKLLWNKRTLSQTDIKPKGTIKITKGMPYVIRNDVIYAVDHRGINGLWQTLVGEFISKSGIIQARVLLDDYFKERERHETRSNHWRWR